MSILDVKDKDFKEKVLEADKPVLCDFWAEWCGPCKQISPILHELAEDYKEKILIAKVNIDENPEVPSNYGIMSIPTLILFKNGQSISSQVGLVEKSSLTTWLDENI
ncbi:MAG: thioredoxin [Rhodobacteraceae bacterium]|nr:thioredoxin [Paracoccaceae bacterium]OUU62485.1 MAG: thioredoxin [Alphaproteobacteria bacterium TMED62]|tara:strand:+ start:25483 stop:25803 length:321 start_codon:yes stop_codon:yes gene_type:complete